MEEVLSDFLLLSFHPGRKSSLWGWELGTQGEMETEKGMCSKPAECPLSPEKAVVARSLLRALGLPERVTSQGVSEWLVVGEGRAREGKGQHPSSH